MRSEGKAETIDDEGCLILLDDNGTRKKITNGDVTLRV